MLFFWRVIGITENREVLPAFFLTEGAKKAEFYCRPSSIKVTKKREEYSNAVVFWLANE